MSSQDATAAMPSERLKKQVAAIVLAKVVFGNALSEGATCMVKAPTIPPKSRLSNF